MSKRKELRQQKILEELEALPTLRIADMARSHAVSTETIRRDLDELTEKGLLNRTYGGAVRAMNSEPTVTDRHKLFTEQREHIARETVKFIRDGKLLMIGSGATTVHIARRIATEMHDITVITHSFGVATVLSINPTIRVIVAPGEYLASEGAMTGAQTLLFLRQFTADYAIIGASGLSTAGPSEAMIDCGTVFNAMILQSNKTVVVADHSKFELAFPYNYVAWQRVDALFTDALPPEHFSHALTKEKVEVFICNAVNHG
ncbi:DeoR/GlpR family DNA-binding transcription regulator [Pantoea cypripedii]|uniref:DeoR/GlpR family DNA-binding transcription regulator n=1 Tax=Pantoea cypripedii TaxID=55209 RepID=UPI002FC99560